MGSGPAEEPSSGDEGGAERRREEAREPFEVLVERHAGRIFRVVLSVLGPGREAEAEDVTQEVFLELHGKLATFRGDSRLSTWLHRLALRRAIDRGRLARLRRPHLGDETLPEVAAGDPDDPERGTIERLRRRRVRSAVAALPEPQRTVVYLRYWADEPVAAIAESLGVAEGTIKAQLFRARRRLAGTLGDARERSE